MELADVEQIKLRETVRDWFLNKLSGNERKKFELVILENDISEDIAIAEDSLIEDYLDNSLSQEDRNLFEQYYMVIESRRKKNTGSKILSEQCKTKYSE